MIKQQIKNLLRYRFLLSELVRKSIKLKYRRSYLGIIWSLIEPLLEMIVLAIVFGTLYGNPDKTFPVYILTGRLLYSFFAQGTRASLSSIRLNSAMIKKVYVPKYLYPSSAILSNFVIFGISLIDLVGVCLFFKVYPTPHLFMIWVPLLLLLVLTMGMGMILATLGVLFRDFEYLWSVALMMIMYTCAIFYQPDKILASEYSWVLSYNPLYGIISLFRDVIFGRPFDYNVLIYTIVICFGLLLFGIVFFQKKQDSFILHI